MSNTVYCTGVTRTGNRCRNLAQQGSDPARCRHHPFVTAAPDIVPAANTAEERAAIDVSRSLDVELRLVREVLMRLADRLDDPTYTLLPEDLRTLATLIFSGVRTVAYLVSRQEDTADVQAWLDQALDSLSAEFSADL